MKMFQVGEIWGLLHHSLNFYQNISFFIFSDLSSKSDLKNVIVNSFAADPEDIKNAASFSLGKFRL